MSGHANNVPPAGHLADNCAAFTIGASVSTIDDTVHGFVIDVRGTSIAPSYIVKQRGYAAIPFKTGQLKPGRAGRREVHRGNGTQVAGLPVSITAPSPWLGGGIVRACNWQPVAS